MLFNCFCFVNFVITANNVNNDFSQKELTSQVIVALETNEHNDYEALIKKIDENIKSIKGKLKAPAKGLINKIKYKEMHLELEEKYKKKLFFNAELFSEEKYSTPIINYAVLSIMFEKNQYDSVIYRIEDDKKIGSFSKMISNKLQMLFDGKEESITTDFFLPENICDNLIAQKFVGLYKKFMQDNDYKHLEFLLLCESILENFVNEYFDISKRENFINRSSTINKTFILHKLINNYVNVSLISSKIEKCKERKIMTHIISNIYLLYIKHMRRISEKDTNMHEITFSIGLLQDMKKILTEKRKPSAYFQRYYNLLEEICGDKQIQATESIKIKLMAKDIYFLQKNLQNHYNNNEYEELTKNIPNILDLSDFLKFIGLYIKNDEYNIDTNETLLYPNFRHSMTKALDLYDENPFISVKALILSWLNQYKLYEWSNWSFNFFYKGKKYHSIFKLIKDGNQTNLLGIKHARLGDFGKHIEICNSFEGQIKTLDDFHKLVEDTIEKEIPENEILLVKTACFKLIYPKNEICLIYNECDLNSQEDKIKNVEKHEIESAEEPNNTSNPISEEKIMDNSKDNDYKSVSVKERCDFFKGLESGSKQKE